MPNIPYMAAKRDYAINCMNYGLQVLHRTLASAPPSAYVPYAFRFDGNRRNTGLKFGILQHKISTKTLCGITCTSLLYILKGTNVLI
jgi:hypothetical protein